MTPPRVLVPRILLAAYVALVAFIVFQPVPDLASGTVWDVTTLLHDLGLDPVRVTGARVEFVLNALMFAPIPFLGSLGFPRVRWADWVVACFVGSFAIEVLQGSFLEARSAQYVDIVSNTLGGLVGAVASLLVGRVVGRSIGRGSRRRAEPEVPGQRPG